MYIDKPLPFIKDFVDQIDIVMNSKGMGFGLSKAQKRWFCFCIMCIIITNSINWAGFERISLQTFTQAGVSWMFRKSKIAWDIILSCAVRVVIQNYGIKSGVLVLDDSDNARSKNTKQIYKTYKIKDKKTGGYVNGQSLVMLVLVSEMVTIPVSFAFYAPDSEIQKWKKEDAKLKTQGVKKKDRPACPVRNKDYPTKEELAIKLLKEFSVNFPDIVVKAVDADALYGTERFMDTSSEIFQGVQVVSQLRKNQVIQIKNQEYAIENYFAKKPYYPHSVIKMRGKDIKVDYCYTIAKIKSHHWKKRIIIALRYEGEKEYRYLTATNMSWKAETIVQTYSLRWLVEVFFQDWKTYEGWGHLTKHTGYDGSSRGLILSLMLDLSLLLHPVQKVRIKDKLPAYTVGSLQEKIEIESLIQFIANLLNEENPKEKLLLIVENADLISKSNFSTKHLNNINWDFLEMKNAA